MERNRTVLRTFLEFILFLSLSYLCLNLFFIEYYNLMLILSSLSVAAFFDMSVEYSFFNLSDIKFITNMVLNHPELEKTYSAGFIIKEEITEKIDLILFKLPLLVALILTFSKNFKIVILSLSIIFLVQLFYGCIIVLDMMFTASKSNVILNSYLQFQGISELIIGFVRELKLFFYIWFQKFLPLLIGFYLWVAGGYSFAKIDLKNYIKNLDEFNLRSVKVSK